MLRPEEAWARVETGLRPLGGERCARRSALGRVLTAGVSASTDVPALDVSAMDGFALAGEPSPAGAAITGSIAAGAPPGFVLRPGDAVRIMTGAPVPEGADRVVPIEWTASAGDRVRIERPVPAGANLRRRGEIHRRGDAILAAGAVATPGALALLATRGIAEVEVHRRPRVAIVVTGDEVVPPEAEPAPGQLRDSHTDFLVAACASLGLAAEPLGIAADDPAVLRARLAAGLGHDLLLVSGGVSKGAYDLVEAELAELGCEILCDAVAMQPGKPLVIAAHRGGWVLGLPGNPASAMVGVWLFARPLLRRLQGHADGFWQGALTGRLAADLPGAKDRDRFLPAEARFQAGEVLVTPVAPRGSHDLAAFARGRALARVRAGSSPRRAGEPCEVLPLADWPADRP